MASPPKHKFEERIENRVRSLVMDGEMASAKATNDMSNSEFEQYIDMFDSERTEKDYDWMSDLSLPEFAARMLTQSSLDVAQYFTTRDFVETYLDDESEEAIANAAAAKELINRTLNQRHLYHYLKYVRGKTISNINGRVILKCWWEQGTRLEKTGEIEREEELEVDVFGDDITSPDQEPARRTFIEDQIEEKATVDRFNYDVWDPRNVFMDRKYTYSLQEKDFVIFRAEQTIQELEANAEKNGYFNLDLLREVRPQTKSETRDETEYEEETMPANALNKYFDVYERYGKFWVIDGKGGDAKPGIDEDGKPLDKATFEHVILTIAQSGSSSVLIGFHRTPYVDSNGAPYIPAVRGLCYVHPVQDDGVGDGRYAKDIQKGIDDTFNLSNDRVRLATMPTMKGRKHSLTDNDTVYFEPGHTIELNQMDDLQEIPISDNVTGAMLQIGDLRQMYNLVTNLSPSVMGSIPAEASTKATAIAAAEQRANIRSNYKSMTFENTALVELYWMIQQMTFRFAKQETGFKLMGDKVFDFDPEKDYYYKPVSQAIETEYSKNNKSNKWIQLFGMAAQLAGQHPDGVKMLNFIFSKIAENMDDEVVNFSRAFLDENVAVQQQGGAGSQPGVEGQAVSNQFGVPISNAEAATREGANG